ncbi:MAG: peptidoglycan-binding protein [Acidimicrobiia bacterium]
MSAHRWWVLASVNLVVACGGGDDAEPATTTPATASVPVTSTTPSPPTTAVTSTTMPRSATTPSMTAPEARRLLRTDGLGPHAFGSTADQVEGWLADQLGPADVVVVEPGQGGWPLMSCAERRFAYWASAGLTVGFTDLNSYDATGQVPDCDDTPHLAGWYVTAGGPPWFAPGHTDVDTPPPLTVRLTTNEGIELGTTVGELRVAFPTVEFGEWDIDEYVPQSFHVATNRHGLRGRVDWNPVTSVQHALNERGATLAVDGLLGPRTRAALLEFQTSIGIAEPETNELGVIGPTTLAALDVAVPDSAAIDYLTAGTWDWDF